MKKFFKALALVLALTLVVGVVPATAARAEVMKDKTLYLDGAKGTSEDGKACAVKAKKAIYKLAGYTKDTKEGHEFKAVAQKDGIVTITKNYVKAAAIGTVDVDIYDGDVKIGTTTVKVKKNATADSLVLKVDDGDVPEKLIAGAKYTFKLPRVGKDTDERRIFVNGTQLTDIKDHARQFEYTCTEDDAKAGKITVKYESFQSKTYNAYTQTKTVEIPVTLGTMDNAIQTTYEKFDIKFSSESTAKAAVDATTPSLSQGTAAVTENKEIVKVFEVGKNGEEIAAFIRSLAVDTTDKTLVHVTMFSDLKQETVYKVQYGDVTKQFKAVKWQPAGITDAYAYVANKDIAGGTATLTTYVYAIGDQSQHVDITAKVKDLGNFAYEDANKNNDYTKYNVSGNLVDFYVNNYTAKVNVTFTYYGNGAGEEYKDLDYPVTSSDNRVFTVINYYLDGTLDTPNPGDKREAFISADEGNKALDVKIKIDTLVDGKAIADPEYAYGDDPMVKFVTTNTDKLAIEEATGYLYAPKAANADIAVWVYYGEKVVDADPNVDGVQPIMVTVYDHKRLGSASQSIVTDGRLYGYSGAFTGTDKQGYDIYQLDADVEQFAITVLDVQGRPYDEVEFEVEKVTDALDTTVGVTPRNPVEVSWNAGFAELVKDGTTGIIAATDVLKKTNTTNVFLFNFDESKNNTIPANDIDLSNKSSKSLTYKITVSDLNSTQKRYVTVTFKAKNVDNATVTSKVVENVPNTAQYRVVGTDSESFRVCGYTLANDGTTLTAGKKLADFAIGSKLYLGFFRNADGKEMTWVPGVAGKTVVLKTVENVPGGGLTKLSSVAEVYNDSTAPVTTGGAIYCLVVDDGTGSRGSSEAYISAGSYSARAYTYKSSKRSVVNTKAFDFNPSLNYTLSWRWKNAYVETTDVDVAIEEAIEFTYIYTDRANSWRTYKFVGTIDDFATAGALTDKNGNKVGNTTTTVTNPVINIALSYTEKENDSVSVLYAYVDAFDAAVLTGQAGTVSGATLSGQLFVETPILRTIYLGQSK